MKVLTRGLTRVLTIVLTTGLIISCAAPPPAPVDHRPQPPSKKISTHIVGKGETLFSIAWSYSLDFRSLARANGIGSSYTIHPGQVLNLSVGSAPPVISRSAPSKTYTPSKTTSKAVKQSRQPPKTYRASTQPVVKNISDGSIKWRWPATGKIIQAFSASRSVNKGIDIEGNLGDTVQAAASGGVVYAGSGLVGYGQLIIIKHNDRFLSAYAHNRILNVKEGDKISAGQKIAEVGSSGAERVKLHFEIRRDGKPVNPEGYLPRR